MHAVRERDRHIVREASRSGSHYTAPRRTTRVLCAVRVAGGAVSVVTRRLLEGRCRPGGVARSRVEYSTLQRLHEYDIQYAVD